VRDERSSAFATGHHGPTTTETTAKARVRRQLDGGRESSVVDDMLFLGSFWRGHPGSAAVLLWDVMIRYAIFWYSPVSRSARSPRALEEPRP
jgi:hypothetical protein